MKTSKEKHQEARRVALAKVEALAASLGVKTLPLDVVAPMLPTSPEWEEYERLPRKRGRR